MIALNGGNEYFEGRSDISQNCDQLATKLAKKLDIQRRMEATHRVQCLAYNSILRSTTGMKTEYIEHLLSLFPDHKKYRQVWDDEPQDYVEFPSTGEGVDPPTAGEDVDPPTAVENVDPLTAVENVDPPTAGEDMNPPAAGEDMDLPIAGEDVHPPTAGEDVNPPTTAGEGMNSPTAGEDVDPPTTVCPFTPSVAPSQITTGSSRTRPVRN